MKSGSRDREVTGRQVTGGQSSRSATEHEMLEEARGRRLWRREDLPHGGNFLERKRRSIEG